MYIKVNQRKFGSTLTLITLHYLDLQIAEVQLWTFIITGSSPDCSLQRQTDKETRGPKREPRTTVKVVWWTHTPTHHQTPPAHALMPPHTLP